MQASAAYGGLYRAMISGYEVSAAQIARDHVALADHSGAVLGFYSLILEPEAELDLMFTADAAQGRGIGRLLMSDMAKAAAGYGARSVKIVSHPPAAGFYRRLGAVDVGTQQPSGGVSWARPVLRLPVG